MKEQKKVSEEPSHEKSEVKSAKKKLEKKDKVPEKKDESQEEKKTQKEDKLEKSDKPEKSSTSSVSVEAEELQKKQGLPQDTSTDSEPVTTTNTVTTSFSDDTCDALSDITPEPTEGEAESGPGDVSAVPAEADALLALMDVCASAEARLPAENVPEEVTTEITLQDVDMKMKEAALTLLSMAPASTVAERLVSQDTKEEAEVEPTAPQPMETSVAEEEEQRPPADEQTAAVTEITANETSPTPSQEAAEIVEEKPKLAGMCERKEDAS